MGCCFSQPGHSTAESPTPNERTRLLDENGRPVTGDSGSGTSGQSLPPTASPEMKAHPMREKDMLKRIVQQTAEGLIDISSVRLLDRIQQDHANERSNEYQNIITSVADKLSKSIQTNVTNPSSTAFPISSSPTKSSVILDLLRPTPGGSIRADQLEFIRESVGKVRDAVEDGVQVRECGSIVVNL